MNTFFELPGSVLSADEITTLRDQSLRQHKWARQYSLQLIESVPEELWFQVPPGMSTHLAWQVGHLAVSQYGLMLFRQRGRAEGDVELMPGWLRKQYGRGSEPGVQTDNSPTRDELLQRLTDIHNQSHAEVANLAAETLREPCDMPYCVYPIKLGALLFAPIHEGIHAGQIGLIRRGLGLPPIH